MNLNFNMFELGLYDAHCHFFEFHQKKILEDEIQQAKEAGIKGFFCSALGERQFLWYSQNSDKCYWYAGIHPYFEESKESDFHVVGKYYELYKILKKNFPKVRGILHSFNASKDIFQVFKNFDLAFSIGNKFNNNELAKDIIKHGFYTLETDAPYQKSKNEKSNFNHLKNLKHVLNYLSVFENKEKILITQYKTLKELFSL